MSQHQDETEATTLLMATLEVRQDALAALLDARFLNVEQEVEGSRTEIVVSPDGREPEARAILTRHGGIGVDLSA